MKSTKSGHEILPVSFSSYVILNPSGNSLNPLGLQSTHNYLYKLLFPQFTTLSNYPRYHLILCVILHYLEDNKDIKNFPKKFREIENLWGIAQTINEKQNPINVEKYKGIINDKRTYDKNKVYIREVNNSKSGLFDRLNYGVLGFYIEPSRAWGLVERTKGFHLTENGKNLANIILSKKSLKRLFDEWTKGEILELENSFKEFIKQTSIIPDDDSYNEEKRVWKEILKDFVGLNSYKLAYLGELWKNLPDYEGIIQLSENEESYKDYFNFETITNTKIKEIIRSYDLFEKFSSTVEFLFDLEYLEIQQNINSNFQEIKDEVFKEFKKSKVLAELQKFSLPDNNLKLFIGELERSITYEKFFQSIFHQHCKIQEAKSKRIFFSLKPPVIQTVKNDSDNLKNCLEAYNKTNQLSTIQYYYRRDWQFERAAYYKEFWK